MCTDQIIVPFRQLLRQRSVIKDKISLKDIITDIIHTDVLYNVLYNKYNPGGLVLSRSLPFFLVLYTHIRVIHTQNSFVQP